MGTIFNGLPFFLCFVQCSNPNKISMVWQGCEMTRKPILSNGPLRFSSRPLSPSPIWIWFHVFLSYVTSRTLLSLNQNFQDELTTADPVETGPRRQPAPQLYCFHLHKLEKKWCSLNRKNKETVVPRFWLLMPLLLTLIHSVLMVSWAPLLPKFYEFVKACCRVVLMYLMGFSSLCYKFFRYCIFFYFQKQIIIFSVEYNKFVSLFSEHYF